MEVRKLTKKGTLNLERKLLSLRDEAFPPINMKEYDSSSVPSIQVDQNKKFSNKFEAGRYLLDVFQGKPDPDDATWNWLSLIYFEQLLNRNGKVGEIQRIFISPTKLAFYPNVHLLKTPHDICNLYKNDLDKVDFLLSDPLNVSGGIYLEISKRAEMIKNPCFLQVARKLFYNENKKMFKKGMGISRVILRLIKVWKQYERGFDMYHMNHNQFLRILKKKHKEFDKFL